MCFHLDGGQSWNEVLLARCEIPIVILGLLMNWVKSSYELLEFT